MSTPLAITRIALSCALGDAPMQVWDRAQAGDNGLSEHPPLKPLPSARAGVVPAIHFRPWLKRRKDAKLMTRSARLALGAAGRAMDGWTGDRDALGLFFGVGREPPDEGEAEAALAAAASEGMLDVSKLAGRGRDLYPPLLPLKTLPNMVLAHISIHLQICGENGAWAGEAEAASRAALEGAYAVAEGRAPAALVGAADSLIDLGSARDRLRMGRSGPPGEAAAAML
ncbi:MAG: beta-ketoacyl synthase N-terminal-like domain-containing protein, partial [Myxococcota bacterium]